MPGKKSVQILYVWDDQRRRKCAAVALEFLRFGIQKARELFDLPEMNRVRTLWSDCARYYRSKLLVGSLLSDKPGAMLEDSERVAVRYFTEQHGKSAVDGGFAAS